MAKRSYFKTFLFMFFLRSVSASDPEVSCVFRQSCLLPCQIQSSSDPLIHWIKLSAGDLVVHSYYEGKDQLGHQNQNFQNRTSLFLDQISRGNASLLLKEVKIQDEGRYKCYTSTASAGFKESFINLKAEAPITDEDPPWWLIGPIAAAAIAAGLIIGVTVGCLYRRQLKSKKKKSESGSTSDGKHPSSEGTEMIPLNGNTGGSEREQESRNQENEVNEKSRETDVLTNQENKVDEKPGETDVSTNQDNKVDEKPGETDVLTNQNNKVDEKPGETEVLTNQENEVIEKSRETEDLTNQENKVDEKPGETEVLTNQDNKVDEKPGETDVLTNQDNKVDEKPGETDVSTNQENKVDEKPGETEVLTNQDNKVDEKLRETDVATNQENKVDEKPGETDIVTNQENKVDEKPGETDIVTNQENKVKPVVEKPGETDGLVTVMIPDVLQL